MACGLLLLVLLICYYPATRSQPNNDINKNSSTISYGRFSTTHLPILHLQHYGHFFGGDSRGIPPTCKHNQLIHDILISSEPTKHYTHPSKTTIKILINLSKNSYHIPIQIWELFEVDPPDAHFVFRPNTLLGNKPQFLLFESIQTLQCILTTCTASLSSIDACQFDLHHIYNSLTLLAHLSSLANEFNYAELLLKDSIEILDLLPLSTTTSTIFSYSYLGEISLLRDDFDTGLTHFMHLINNFSENLPLKVFLRVSAIHLVKGDIQQFAHFSQLAHDRYVRNLKKIAPNGEFFNYNQNIESSCFELVNHLLPYASGQSEAPNSLGVMELMKLMHTCVNSENSAIKKTLQLKAELHFEIGKSLKKRGYTSQAHHHFSLSSSPFESNASVHRVTLSTSLPLIHQTMSSFALLQSAFSHSVAILLDQTKNSNFRSCEAVEQSFDSLPLMHYIDDEPLDIIGMNTNMPNNNIYSHISRLFYGLCPKLSNLEFLYLPLPHPHNHNEKKKRKKRIGIVSSKLVNHDVLKLHGGLLSHLSNAENRNDFELFVACYPTPVDSTTSRIQRTILSGGGSPINLVGPPGSDDAARRLQNAELDVIVYLDVNIDPRTFALAHRRIARVQVALWGGWTYTSGVSDAVDYFLVPDAMLPVGEEALNSEQVVRFDGLYTGEMFGGNSKGYTGRSENSPYSNRTKLLETFMIDKEACIINVPASAVKFHPEFDSYLKGILKAEKTCFLLIGAREETLGSRESSEHPLFANDVLQYGNGGQIWAQKLKERMKKSIGGGRGGSSIWKRVRFMDTALNSDDYAAVLRHSAVALDTYPVGNLVGGIEALNVGVPVVTVPSKQHAGGGRLVRGVYTILGQNKNPDSFYNECCIGRSVEDAIGKVSKLVREREYSDLVKKQLREEVDILRTSKEGNVYARQIEDFLFSV